MKWIKLYLPAFLLFLACDVDHGLEPTQSGFSGLIHFTGDWPENTDQVLVVASTVFPPGSLDELILGEPLPLAADSAYYKIWAPPGDFKAVGVVWKEKDQPWDVTNIIGMYFQEGNTFAPRGITIPDRQTMIEGIDIHAELTKAKPSVDSYITGKIRVNGEWPEEAQSVLIVASKNIFPSGLLDVQFSPPIEAGFNSTNYIFNIQPGTYQLIATLLLEKDKDIGLTSIRSYYKKNPSDLFPGKVIVDNDKSLVSGIDLELDFTLE